MLHEETEIVRLQIKEWLQYFLFNVLIIMFFKNEHILWLGEWLSPITLPLFHFFPSLFCIFLFHLCILFSMTTFCQQHPCEVQKHPPVRVAAWDFLVMLWGNHWVREWEIDTHWKRTSMCVYFPIYYSSFSAQNNILISIYNEIGVHFIQ